MTGQFLEGPVLQHILHCNVNAGNAGGTLAVQQQAAAADAGLIGTADLLQWDLLNALIPLGIVWLETHGRLVDYQGLTLVRALAQISKKQVKDLVDYHNAPLTMTNLRPLRLGYMQMRNLQALAFNAKVFNAQGHDFDINE